MIGQTVFWFYPTHTTLQDKPCVAVHRSSEKVQVILGWSHTVTTVHVANPSCDPSISAQSHSWSHKQVLTVMNIICYSLVNKTSFLFKLFVLWVDVWCVDLRFVSSVLKYALQTSASTCLTNVLLTFTWICATNLVFVCCAGLVCFGFVFVFFLMPIHSALSSQNWKPTSSLLPTDTLLSFFCFHQTHH